MYEDIRSFFQAFGTPISAGLAALVAWKFGNIQAAINRQQADTARNKLKFELFKQRHDLYLVVVTYMELVATLQPHQDPPNEAFFADTRPIAWLFGPEVYEWTHRDLMRHVGEFHGSLVINRNSMGLRVSNPDTVALSKLRAKFFDYAKQRDAMFGPYLRMYFDAVEPPEAPRRRLFRYRR